MSKRRKSGIQNAPLAKRKPDPETADLDVEAEKQLTTCFPRPSQWSDDKIEFEDGHLTELRFQNDGTNYHIHLPSEVNPSQHLRTFLVDETRVDRAFDALRPHQIRYLNALSSFQTLHTEIQVIRNRIGRHSVVYVNKICTLIRTRTNVHEFSTQDCRTNTEEGAPVYRLVVLRMDDSYRFYVCLVFQLRWSQRETKRSPSNSAYWIMHFYFTCNCT